MKTFLCRLLADVLKPLYVGYYSTVRIRVMNERWFPANLAPAQNILYVFWHSKTFLILQHCRGRGDIAVLTLLDWKNTVYDRLCRRMGYLTVRLAEKRQAALELKGLLEEGYHLGLALDGPKGPRVVMKPCALHLARVTRRPIVAVNVNVKHAVRLPWRWDRFEVPLPFTEGVAVLSNPMEVRDDNIEEVEQNLLKTLGAVS